MKKFVMILVICIKSVVGFGQNSINQRNDSLLICLKKQIMQLESANIQPTDLWINDMTRGCKYFGKDILSFEIREGFYNFFIPGPHSDVYFFYIIDGDFILLKTHEFTDVMEAMNKFVRSVELDEIEKIQLAKNILYYLESNLRDN